MAERWLDRGDAAGRAATLNALDILDTPPEREFDEITEHVAFVCEVPIALISLLDNRRQWFKSAMGIGGVRGSPLKDSICLHALRDGDVLEIPDTATDPRTHDNAFVIGEQQVRFYAGAPLKMSNGVVVGTLCVLDRQPRNLTAAQRATLRLCARQVVREIELRRALEVERQMTAEIDHRVKNSLQMVMAYLRLQRRTATEEAAAALAAAEQRVGAISMLHAALNAEGGDETVDLSAYLVRIVEFLRETLPRGVRLDTDLAPARIEAKRAAAVGQIVNEFITNSSKHAFPGGRGGTVRVAGRGDGGSYRLEVSDDGVGMPQGAGRGLGLAIMETAAMQLGATLHRATGGPGTRFEIAFEPHALAAQVAPARDAG